MADTVNVPLLGQHKKGTVIGVTIGGFAVAGYMIYRRVKQNQAAQAATNQAAATSGYGYGAQYGYGASGGENGYYGYGQGPYGYGASGGFPAGYYGYGTPSPPSGAASTTNAQWSQAAESQLTNTGYDPGTVAAALGNYITGQAVTPAQRTIVQAAIAFEGYPPQPGPNNNPPGIVTGGTTGGGQGGTVTVPSVVGDRAENARAALRSADLSYNISDNATGTVRSQSPKAGAKVKTESRVTLQLTPFKKGN